MIFDCNLAIGHWPFRNLRFTGMPGCLKAHLRSHGVDSGIVRSYEAPFCADLNHVNDELTQYCPEGFLAAPAVRPDYGAWKMQFAAKVVSLYPSFHCYSLMDEKTLEMGAELSGQGKVMLIVVREEDERGQNPLCKVAPVPAKAINDFASKLPNARIVVVNAGQGEMALLTAPNVFADFAYSEAFPALPSLLQVFPAERLLFGSHTPMFYTTAALNKLADAGLNQTQLDLISSQNARKLFP